MAGGLCIFTCHFIMNITIKLTMQVNSTKLQVKLKKTFRLDSPILQSIFTSFFSASVFHAYAVVVLLCHLLLPSPAAFYSSLQHSPGGRATRSKFLHTWRGITCLSVDWMKFSDSKMVWSSILRCLVGQQQTTVWEVQTAFSTANRPQ